MGDCVFEVPIYRCSFGQYARQMEKDVAKHLDWLERASGGVTREEAPHTFRVSEEHFRRTYGGRWWYNQVIGWLRICADHGAIWGEVWLVDAKRMQRRMKKHYIELGKVFQLHDCSGKPSEEIFAGILDEIERLERRKPFRGRYFELGPLRRIGPYANWHGIANAN